MEKELTFGKWLRRTRILADLTQRDIAKMAGVSLNYVSALERDAPTTKFGKAMCPKPDKVVRLAEAVGASVDEALERAGFLSNRHNVFPSKLWKIDFSQFDTYEIKEIVGFIELKLSIKREKENQPNLAKVYESDSAKS